MRKFAFAATLSLASMAAVPAFAANIVETAKGAGTFTTLLAAAGVQVMSPNFVAQPAEAVIPPPQGQGDASRQTKSSPPASGDPIAGTLQVADET